MSFESYLTAAGILFASCFYLLKMPLKIALLARRLIPLKGSENE